MNETVRGRTVVIIDADPQRAAALSAVLTSLGADPATVPEEPTDGWGGKEAALVILGDTATPAADLAETLARQCPGVPVARLQPPADWAPAGNVIDAIDFPCSYTTLLDLLHRAEVYRRQYALHASPLPPPRLNEQQYTGLVGSSAGIVRVREMMARVAETEATVLITGPSGSGKEVVARNLHLHSNRAHAPFVPVNCGAIPRELLESELFGHEKGAFTGAISSRAGRFELARGGTLFLDEIGDMPLDMQVKILRVLQERQFERVGSSKTLQADVRIIAATHKDLEAMIRAGDFREDLYYRLNVFPLDMPALRERPEDIPLLIHALVREMEARRRGSVRFDSRAMASLCRYDWPGNIRELANLVERMAIMHPAAVVGAGDLPERFRCVEAEEPDFGFAGNGEDSRRGTLELPEQGIELKAVMADLERGLIEQALQQADGVVARAAQKLGVQRTTLVEKMRRYGVR